MAARAGREARSQQAGLGPGTVQRRVGENRTSPVGCPCLYPLFPASCPYRVAVALSRSSPSQTPPRGITPVGSSGRTHPSSPRTCDPRSQQRMAVQELRVFLPSQRPSPRPPAEPFLPGLPDAPKELPQTAVVRGTAIVLVVAAEFRVEGGLLPVHGVMAMCSAPFGDPFQGPPQALLHRLDVDRELASPTTRALVGQAEEIEGVGFRPHPVRSREGFAPK